MSKPWLIFFCFLVSGCVTQPDWHWHKSGATEQEFEVDQSSCLMQAEQSVGNSPYIAAPFGSPAMNAMLTQKLRIHTLCMRSKGWTQVQNAASYN